MKLRIIKRISHKLPVGAEVELSGREARLFIAAKLARVIDEGAGPDATAVETPAVPTPTPPATPEPAPEPPEEPPAAPEDDEAASTVPPRRRVGASTYRRRNLTADPE